MYITIIIADRKHNPTQFDNGNELENQPFRIIEF